MAQPESVNNICVFAASVGGTDPIYREHAQQLGELIADNGFGLVYGGIPAGLMRVVAKAASDKGAEVTGVLPAGSQNLTESESELLDTSPLSVNDRLVTVSSLEARKYAMLQRSKGVIALAGGFGTFDEIVTTIEINRGHPDRGAASRLVVLNTDGFYDGLEQQLARLGEEGFAGRGAASRAVTFVTTPEEAVEHIQKQITAPRAPGGWPFWSGW